MRYTIGRTETTDIIIGQHLLQDVNSIVSLYKHTSYMLICDKRTELLFAKEVLTLLKILNVPLHIHVLNEGEKTKSFSSLSSILKAMMDVNIDRKGAIIALGGGVVGDIATLAAALYKRGIDCIQIPTTLLAQVDSSLGGKGAVNLGMHKNSVGIIAQPKLVIIDTNLLKTLPLEQIKSGMGEVVKYAIAMDKTLFNQLEKKSISSKMYPQIVKRCVELKMKRVVQDPLDTKGVRVDINFGHTLGHAIELLGRISHGEAISIGMVFAIRLSVELALLDKKTAHRAINLINKFSLPTTIQGIKIDKVMQLMQQDKKAIKGEPQFVLLKDIGKTVINYTAEKAIIKKLLEEIVG